MNDMNKITISGRLVKAPKAVLFNAEGEPKMCSVDIAVNKFDSIKEDGKKVEFYHAVAFGITARRLCALEKGTPIMIDGSVSIKENEANGTTFHNMSVIVKDFTITHWAANVSDLQVSGRVAKEIKLKTTSKGTPWVSFDIAVKYYDYSKGQEATQFINVMAYKDLAERLVKATDTGYRILVTGYLSTNIRKDSKKGVTYTNNSIIANKFQVLDQGKKTTASKKSA